MTEPRPPKPLRLTEEIKALIAARADLPPTAKTPDTKILLTKDAGIRFRNLQRSQDTNARLSRLERELLNKRSKMMTKLVRDICIGAFLIAIGYEYAQFRETPKIIPIVTVEACFSAHAPCPNSYPLTHNR